MDSLVFHIDADKVGPNLGESIRAYFGNRRVQVIVKPDPTDADLMAGDEADNQDYALPYNDIARIAETLARNEPVDVAAEMKRFMEAK